MTGVCLFGCVPHVQVDHLCLKGNKRWLYTKQEVPVEGGQQFEWIKQYVNPWSLTHLVVWCGGFGFRV